MINPEPDRTIEGYLFPLSSAQKRVWILAHVNPQDFSYNIPLALHIKGPLNRTALEQSLIEIIKRHEILRTSFALVDDEPVQIIPTRFDWAMGFEGLTNTGAGLSYAQVIERMRAEAARPFDLAKGPLVRATLYQLGIGEHILFLNLHHIVCDGWSLGILVQEISVLYPFCCRHERAAETALPELESQYVDYSEWHREWLQSEAVKPHLDYWKKRLGGELPRLNLPTDYPRPAIASPVGGVVRRLLGKTVLGELQRFSLRSGATLFMTMHAAFVALLHRYTGAEDIIIGTPVANRHHYAIENTIGLFVNSLALRTQVTGEWKFTELLERVKADCLEAFVHQDMPFEMLVEQLEVERSSAFSPVFQVMFALQNGSLGEITWPGLDVSALRVDNGSSKLDLTLIAEETKDGLLLTLEYATDLFLEDTANRLLNYYSNLLSAAPGHPNRRICELSLLDAAGPGLIQQTAHVANLQFEATSLKVEREALSTREREEQGEEKEEGSNEVEEKVMEVWKEVLGLKRVGIDDNFFESGGDSILALQLAAKARKRNLNISPMNVLQHQTIRKLAKVASQIERPPVVTKQGGEIPLTPIQHWFFDLVVPQRSHWNQSIVVELKQAALGRDIESALRAIAGVHSAFGLRFRHEGIRWSQRYEEEGEQIPFAVIDLSDFAAVEQEAALLSAIANLQESLDIENGPLARAVYFQMGATKPRLLAIAIHHLIIDGVSWRILIEDLAEALLHCNEQEPQALAAASESFGGWARRLQRAAMNPELAKQADYWLANPGDYLWALPTDHAAGPEQNTEGSKAVVSNILGLDRPASPNHAGAGWQANDIGLMLLASFAKLCAEVTRHNAIRIAIDDHGRRDLGEAVDVSRTIGWFTGIYPLLLRGCDEPDYGVLLESIERQLEQVPQHGIGYGLLRYSDLHSGIREKLIELPEPQISFNYFGQMSAGHAAGEIFKLRRDLDVNTRSAGSLRPFAIDLVAFVDDGKLQIDWIFSDNLHDRSTVERWASLLITHVRRFFEEANAARQGLSPSDFPLSGLRQRALNKLAEFARDNIEDIYPLSPMQQGMLFHTIYDDQEKFYFEQLTAKIKGELNITAFRQAWQDVIDRHQALRTCFFWEGLDKPMQVALRHVETPLRYEDWSALGETEQAERLQLFLRNDRNEGFILSQCPPLRVALIHAANDSWHLIWSFHHILLDGWSLPIIFTELLKFYEARVSGLIEEVSPPPQFRDYVAWLLRQDMNRAECFWRAMLEGYTPARIEGQKAVAEGGYSDCREEKFELTDDLYGELQKFAQRHHLTLNTVVQGAWALLLHRYGCGDDVVFGTTVSGRTAELQDIEHAVGLFINTLPLRVRIDRGRRLTTWLHEIQARQFESHSYSYCRLVDIHRWSQGASDSALFESLVVFENYPVGEAVRQQGRSLVVTDINVLERTNYPLTLAIIPGHTLTFKLDFHASRFSRATASRMLAELRQTLTNIADSSSFSVGYLLHKVALESDSLTCSHTSAEALPPASTCVHSVFEAQAMLRPHATALATENSQMSYGELNARANQLATRLRREGVGAESVVGLLVTRSYDLIIGILAILKAGGGYLPLDPLHPLERLRYMLSDSGASLLLSQSSLLSIAASLDCPHILLDREAESLRSESAANTCADVSPANLAYIIYTSGTTGKPKGVAVSQAGIERLAIDQGEVFDIDAESRVYQFASPGFDASVSEIFVTLLRGATLFLPETEEGEDCQDLTRTLRDSHATHVTLPPSVLSTLTPSSLPVLKTVVVAGEAGSAETFRRWSDHRRVINAYGPTEATVCASMKVMTTPAQKTPTLGTALRGASLYLLSSELGPVPIGVAGEVYVGGTGLARGYFNQPDLTAASFIPNPFATLGGERMYRTGDRGIRDDDGEIQFIGRLDHQIKLRGYRIELGEIEATLATHPAVETAVVVVRETNAQTRQLAAYVLADPGSALSVEALRQYASERLPAYEVPGIFIQLDSLPLTPNKKIDRKMLASLTQQTVRHEVRAEARNEAEQILLRIWAEVLHAPQVGVQDNYFELGGDSILSLQIASRARDASLDIKPREIMTLQTIERIALSARRHLQPSIETTVDSGPFALTPIQRWFFENNWPVAHHWNQSVTLEIEQLLDFASLCKALRAVFSQHDALRLRFVVSEGGWKEFYDLDEPPPAPHWCDLSALSLEDASASFQRLAASAQASLNLEHGPLFRALYVQLPEGESDRLLLIAHHLIVDAVSWAAVLEDLLTAYHHQGEGDPGPPRAKSHSYKTWAERLSQSADGDTWQDEINFWLDLSSQSAPPFPTDFDPFNESNLVIHRKVITQSLSDAYTSALLKESRSAYNTSAQELLVTALAQTVAEFTGSPAMMFDMESHGREPLWDDLDVSRTVGWFTALYPMRITLGSAYTEPRSSIIAVKEQMRATPRHGLGYGVLRYFSGDTGVKEALAALPVPPISFNYLGSVDSASPLPEGFSFSVRQAPGEQHPSQPIPHLLEVNAYVRQGRLTLNFSFSDRVFRHSTVQALADKYINSLLLLIDHCKSPTEGAYTPSDFAGIELTEEDLNAILDDLSGEQPIEL